MTEGRFIALDDSLVERRFVSLRADGGVARGVA
jgi:hypothetical protein